MPKPEIQEKQNTIRREIPRLRQRIKPASMKLKCPERETIR